MNRTTVLTKGQSSSKLHSKRLAFSLSVAFLVYLMSATGAPHNSMALNQFVGVVAGILFFAASGKLLSEFSKEKNLRRQRNMFWTSVGTMGFTILAGSVFGAAVSDTYLHVGVLGSVYSGITLFTVYIGSLICAVYLFSSVDLGE